MDEYKKEIQYLPTDVVEKTKQKAEKEISEIAVMSFMSKDDGQAVRALNHASQGEYPEPADFKMKALWTASDDRDILLRKTTAAFSLKVGGESLTRNRNIWTRKVDDSVIVSIYPLAKWFAFNWWRLENEFLPHDNLKPNYDWRCAHELGAADHGYVWPCVLFVSDGDFVNVWSSTIHTSGQSVNYLNRLNAVKSVPVKKFQSEVATLIKATLEKLNDQGADLRELWSIVCEDMHDPAINNIRKIEAAMGYDPEECPEALLTMALEMQKRTGRTTVKEFLPFVSMNEQLQNCLNNSNGLEINIQMEPQQTVCDGTAPILPWQRGVAAARWLRRECDFGEDAVSDSQLKDLLGLSSRGYDDYFRYSVDIPVSFGKNNGQGGWTFVPKKKWWMTGRRFELSRLLGDALTYRNAKHEWLVMSDCKTARQKTQRAFAAEFLCPIVALDNFMEGDYSKEKQKKAASHFGVSEKTIKSVLLNNRRINHHEPSFPYSLRSRLVLQ